MRTVGIIVFSLVLLSGCRKISPESPEGGCGVPATVAGSGGLGASGAIAKNTANATSPLGIALARFGAGTSEWISADHMVQAGAWVEVDCFSVPADSFSADQGDLTIGPTGWVDALSLTGTCAATHLFRSAAGSYPAGTYLVKFDGGGTLEVSGDASTVTSVDTGISSFIVTDPTPNGVLLKIRTLRAGDGIRNVRVISPGGVCGKTSTELDPFAQCRTSRGGAGTCAAGLSCYDFADVLANRYDGEEAAAFVGTVTARSRIFFHPLFLNSLKFYRALNFRRWAPPLGMASPTRATIGANLGQFAETRGAPWEVEIALANLLQADPWVTLPVQLTNSDAGTMAAVFAAGLNTNLNPYVEYAGEFWRPSAVRTYLETEASTSGIGSYEDLYIYRMASLTANWKGNFSGSRTQFVETVSASDSGMPDRLHVAEHGLDLFDVVAMAQRFDVPMPAGQDATSITNLFDAIGGVGGASELDAASARASAMVSAAGLQGMALVGYGSGPMLSAALSGSDPRTQARLDARMGTVTARNLATWHTLGGQLIFHDKSADDEDTGSFDPWGSLMNQEDETSEIQKALQSFVEGNPCWWAGCTRASGS